MHYAKRVEIDVKRALGFVPIEGEEEGAEGRISIEDTQNVLSFKGREESALHCTAHVVSDSINPSTSFLFRLSAVAFYYEHIAFVRILPTRAERLLASCILDKIPIL